MVGRITAPSVLSVDCTMQNKGPPGTHDVKVGFMNAAGCLVAKAVWNMGVLSAPSLVPSYAVAWHQQSYQSNRYHMQ